MVFLNLLDRFAQVRPIIGEALFTRSSGNGWHAYVMLDGIEPTPVERIAYQMALGSDIRREVKSMDHLNDPDRLEKCPHVTCFFEVEGYVKKELAHQDWRPAETLPEDHYMLAGEPT